MSKIDSSIYLLLILALDFSKWDHRALLEFAAFSKRSVDVSVQQINCGRDNEDDGISI